MEDGKENISVPGDGDDPFDAHASPPETGWCRPVFLGQPLTRLQAGREVQKAKISTSSHTWWLAGSNLRGKNRSVLPERTQPFKFYTCRCRTRSSRFLVFPLHTRLVRSERANERWETVPPSVRPPAPVSPSVSNRSVSQPVGESADRSGSERKKEEQPKHEKRKSRWIPEKKKRKVGKQKVGKEKKPCRAQQSIGCHM